MSKIRRERRLAIISLLGGKCEECGETDLRVLQLDHRNGGGSKERREIGDPSIVFKMVLEGLLDIRRYNLLCANCNWVKRSEQNEG